MLRYNLRFCADKRYSGVRCLLRTGNIFSTDFCYGEVPLRYDPFDYDTYNSNPMDFYVVCTDVETGKAVYHKYTGWKDHGFDWIRASASMPLVSQIVEIDGRKYLDGGIADSIPVAFFQQLGYDRNVVVLTRPKGYQKKKNGAMPLIRQKYRAYPKLVEAMANRHIVYNNTLAEIDRDEQAGRLFVLRPEKPLPVGRVEKDPKKLQQAYDTGRATAEQNLTALTAYLQK